MPATPPEAVEWQVAKAWGCRSPSEWRALSFQDRKEMMLFELWTSTVESYRDWCREKKDKPKPKNEYQLMKERMGL